MASISVDLGGSRTGSTNVVYLTSVFGLNSIPFMSLECDEPGKIDALTVLSRDGIEKMKVPHETTVRTESKKIQRRGRENESAT